MQAHSDKGKSPFVHEVGLHIQQTAEGTQGSWGPAWPVVNAE